VGTLVILFCDGDLMIDPMLIEEINHERGSSSLVSHRMWSYRLAIKRWFELYDRESRAPALWDFGETPPSVARLFATMPLQKQQHAELLQLRMMLDFFDPLTVERIAKHRKRQPASPQVIAAWRNLIESVSHERSV